MEDQWLARAKRLQSIASTGLNFCTDDYDRERYCEVADIANAMLAELANVPLERIRGLVSDFAQDYATPKIDVRGAVLDADRVLLVREASDGLWTLPGGYADVGLSASENVVKEIAEEAALRVRASALYAVCHKAKHDYTPDVRDFYKLFFLCERLDTSAPQPGLETTDADFFKPEALPPLARGRVVEQDILAAFRFRDNPTRGVCFD